MSCPCHYFDRPASASFIFQSPVLFTNKILSRILYNSFICWAFLSGQWQKQTLLLGVREALQKFFFPIGHFGCAQTKTTVKKSSETTTHILSKFKVMDTSYTQTIGIYTIIGFLCLYLITRPNPQCLGSFHSFKSKCWQIQPSFATNNKLIKSTGESINKH